jgi:hypothetical protein
VKSDRSGIYSNTSVRTSNLQLRFFHTDETVGAAADIIATDCDNHVKHRAEKIQIYLKLKLVKPTGQIIALSCEYLDSFLWHISP